MRPVVKKPLSRSGNDVGLASARIEHLAYTPKHDDLIYDVGLHRGEDAEFYLRKGFRVVAFEANPGLVRSCRKRLDHFISRGQLTLIEGAIVDSESIKAGQTKVPFYKNSDVSAWGTVRSDWVDRNTRLGTACTVTEVEAINFSDVIREHGVPYYMKIDIEGCDGVCMHALSGFVERPTYLSIESDKTRLDNIERELDTLVELGYSAFQAVEHSQIPVCQSPPYPPSEGEYVAQGFEEGSSGLFGSELRGRWKSRREVLRQYRSIRLGYLLLGDDGIMSRWRFRGAGRVRSLARGAVGLLTQAAVPGWYDTHARHSCADGSSSGLG
jgi:FkbM family methyltransferase